MDIRASTGADTRGANTRTGNRAEIGADNRADIGASNRANIRADNKVDTRDNIIVSEDGVNLCKRSIARTLNKENNRACNGADVSKGSDFQDGVIAEV